MMHVQLFLQCVYNASTMRLQCVYNASTMRLRCVYDASTMRHKKISAKVLHHFKKKLKYFFQQ